MYAMPSKDANGSPGDVYFEFTTIGSAVRVAAIDALSGLEVTVVGPASASRTDLERLALRKLQAQLDRRIR
jgi:hypothetical protein